MCEGTKRRGVEERDVVLVREREVRNEEILVLVRV